MLSIGEFSNICKVSAKTLRYYAEIGLLLPEEINPENGYRYYAIGQLEDMLFINGSTQDAPAVHQKNGPAAGLSCRVPGLLWHVISNNHGG